MLAAFGIEPAIPGTRTGADGDERIRKPEGKVTIAIVGKYTGLKDAYKSLIEALSHGGIANRVKVKLELDRKRDLRRRKTRRRYLEKVNGILVPGGFG